MLKINVRKIHTVVRLPLNIKTVYLKILNFYYKQNNNSFIFEQI